MHQNLLMWEQPDLGAQNLVFVYTALEHPSSFNRWRDGCQKGGWRLLEAFFYLISVVKRRAQMWAIAGGSS